MKLGDKVQQALVIGSIGLAVYFYERSRKRNEYRRLMKDRRESADDIQAYLDQEQAICDDLTAALNDPNSYESQGGQAAGTPEANATRCGFIFQRDYACAVSGQSAESYVNDAEALATAFRTANRFGWYENWWEDDNSAFEILQHYEYAEQIELMNIHYQKVTGGRSLWSDVQTLLDRGYLKQLDLPDYIEAGQEYKCEVE